MARAAFPILSEPATPPPNAPPLAPSAPEPARAQPIAPAPPGPDRAAPAKRPEKAGDLWMLSLEGATRAPIDAGLQLTLETPVGVRAFGGYGWVPDAYLGRVLGLASEVSSDPVLAAMVEDGFEGGNVLRLGAGIRPFQSLGLYLDAGYARVSLRGSFDAARVTGVEGLGGTYAVETRLGMVFVELGYQTKIAERLVLGAALGVTKVMSASTGATPGAGAADDPRIDTAAGYVDQGLEKYGVLPTLTLRLGLDLI